MRNTDVVASEAVKAHEGGTAQLRIGAEVRCNAGLCGSVTRVVVDPLARTLTHIVVDPKHHGRPSRLVPLDLVNDHTPDITLRCSMSDFGKLVTADEAEFRTNGTRYPGYDAGQTLFWPHYGLGSSDWDGVARSSTPQGQVSIRRGEQVNATDGDIGSVEGLVIDPRDRKVTHVLLKEGHLWGRKQVAIPITDFLRVGSVLRLRISKHEISKLPRVAIERH